MNEFCVNKPFNQASLSDYVGSSLIYANGKAIDTTNVIVDVIALYFSAHWCPPCRMFTPQLSQIYNDLKKNGKSIEIIFISSDQTSQDFQTYFSSMADWLAVPFKSDVIRALKERYSIQGIPAVVLINGFTGNLIEKDGRSKLLNPSFLASLPPDLDKEVKYHVSIDPILAKFEQSTFTNQIKLVGFHTLIRIIQNVLKFPSEPKFRTLKKSNSNIQSKLNSPYFFLVLKYCGFRETHTLFVCYRPKLDRFQETNDVLQCLIDSLDTISTLDD